MGFGDTAKTVNRLSDLAEKLFKMVKEVLDRMEDLQDRVEEATEDVKAVRREQRRQRAVLEALADAQGVDVEAVLAEADVELEGEDASGGGDAVDGDTASEDGVPARDG